MKRVFDSAHLHVWDDFLEPNQFNEVVEFATDLPLNRNQSSAHWSGDLIRDSQPVGISAPFSETPAALLPIESALRQLKTFDLEAPCSLLVYDWSPGSFIPWHDDGHVEAAFTLYLTEEWDPEWGGQYLSAEPGKEDYGVWFAPKKNRLILNRNNMHRTVATSPVSGRRLAVQGFFADAQRQVRAHTASESALLPEKGELISQVLNPVLQGRCSLEESMARLGTDARQLEQALQAIRLTQFDHRVAQRLLSDQVSKGLERMAHSRE